MKQTLSQNPVKVANRRWLVDALVTMVAYIVILVLSVHALKTGHFSPAIRVLIAIAPAIPVAALIVALVRFLRGIDEFQRQIHLEGFAISAGITAALGLTYGFLESVGFPRVSAFWAFVSIDVFWGLSVVVITLRNKAGFC